MRLIKLYFFICFTLLCARPVLCDVWLPDIFSEGMVLQSGKEIKVWGNASPRERVAVTLRGRSEVTRADRSGRWRVSLPALDAGGPYMLNVLGKNLITINNIWIGDVFVISGDTLRFSSDNTLSKGSNTQTSYSAVFELPKRAPAQAVAYDKRVLQWKQTSSHPVFSRVIEHLNSKGPTGFIISNYPDANLSAWINADSLKNHGIFKDSVDYLQREYVRQSISNSDKQSFDFEDYPSVLFNGMVSPLTAYNVGGILFMNNYKDAPYAFYTDYLYKYLVSSFRDAWSDESLPIIFIDPPLGAAATKREISELLQVQKVLYNFENVSILNLSGNLKGLSAKDFSFALEAISRKDFEAFRLPVLVDVVHEQNKLLLKFKNTKNLRFSNKYGYGRGFYIAGKNRKFVPARAFLINDSTVEVSNGMLENPLEVRYNFNDPLKEGNFLSDKNHVLPVKTDHWSFKTDTSSYRTTWLAEEHVPEMNRFSYEQIQKNNADLIDGPALKSFRSIRDIDKAIEMLQNILGLKKQRPLEIPVHIESFEKDSTHVKENLKIQTGKDTFLDVDFIYSKSSKAQPVLVVDRLEQNLKDSLLKADFSLLVFNPRNLTGLDSMAHINYLIHADTTKNSFLGKKVHDFFRIVDFVQTQYHVVDTSQIHFAQLNSTGYSRLDMFLAFVMDKRVKSVFLQRHLLDIKLEGTDTIKVGQYLYAPLLWQYVSIQDLIRLSAPRALSIFAPVNLENRYLSKNEINILTRRGRYAYYRKNALTSFKIKTGSVYKDTPSLNDASKKAFLEHIFD